MIKPLIAVLLLTVYTECVPSDEVSEDDLIVAALLRAATTMHAQEPENMTEAEEGILFNRYSHSIVYVY